LRQNYPLDLRELRFGRIDDGAIEFSGPAPQARPAEPAAA
jgi:hypothetical protein